MPVILQGEEQKPEWLPERLDENIVYGERLVRKSLIFRKKIFTCSLTVAEPQNFGIIFSNVTTRLLDWYRENEKTAGGVEFSLACRDVTFGKAISSVDTLANSGGVYSFLKKMDVQLHLYKLGGRYVKTYQPEILERK